MPTQEQNRMFDETVHAVERVLPISKVKLSQYQEETQKDQILRKIKYYDKEGWPNNERNVPENTRWAWKIKDQFEVKENVVLLNGKVMIPKNLQLEVLQTLHKSHFGIVKTKKRARQAVYWRGMARDIETVIGKCKICEKFRPANTREPLIQREISTFPFESVAIDICTCGASDYLVIACNKTRWLDIVLLESKTATEVINRLKVFMANHGIPRVLMSDNMPFASKEFGEFTRQWGIDQSFSSPRYPRSNGFAEKMVGIAKMIIKKSAQEGQDLQLALLEYRNSPTEGLSYSPAQLAMARVLRTTLPTATELLTHKLNKDEVEQEEKIRERQKRYYNLHTKEAKPLKAGDSALLRTGKEWDPVVIKDVDVAPRSYIVTNNRGQNYRRNRIHLRKSLNLPPLVEIPNEEEKQLGRPVTAEDTIQEDMNNTCRVTQSGRIVKKPTKLNDYTC